VSSDESLNLLWKPNVTDRFDPNAEAVILHGDSQETLKTVPDECVKLVITSPPYNICR